MELKKNRHSIYNLNYHVVLITKYGHKCINDEVFISIKETVARILEGWNGELLEINHAHDHIHILINLPPKISPTNAVTSIKATTSRVLRRDFKEYLKQFYWKDVFWSASYLIVTSGGASLDVIKKYIENQRG